MKFKLYFFLVLLIPSVCVGQDNYVVSKKQYTNKQGLSHSDVFSFAKDGNGIIWVGTRNGLNRFDGRNFKVFDSKHGLRNEVIRSIYGDNQLLWCIYLDLKTDLNYISLFHTSKEKVIPLKEYFGNNIPFKESEVKFVYIINDTLIICLNNNDVFSYKQNKFSQLSFLDNNNILCGVSNEGAYWVYSKKDTYIHLKKIHSNGEVIEKHHLNTLKVPLLNKFRLIREDKKETSYFGYGTNLNDKRVWVTIPKNKKPILTGAIVKNQKKKSISMISCMAKYNEHLNTYWYSIIDTCMLVGMDNKIYYKDYTSKVKSNISSLIDDKVIFQATKSKGFLKLQLNKNKFHNLFTKKESSFRGINKIDGTLYFNSYNYTYTKNKVLENHNSFVKIKGQNNTIWGSNLIQYTSNFKKILSVIRPSIPNSFEIWSMYNDKKTAIWYSDIGLYKIPHNTTKILKVKDNGFKNIHKSTVYYFHEKGDGKILLCTTTGLYELDIEKGITQRYLSAYDVRHLYFDKQANVYWVATQDDGLLKWNLKTGKKESFLFTNPQTNKLHSVYADANGFLWMSTENGLIQFHKKTKSYKIFTDQDGLPSNEFNRISHYQDTKTGKLYFGTINGICSFYPKDFKQVFFIKDTTKVIPVEVNQFSAKTDKIENVTYNFRTNNQIELEANDRFLTVLLGVSNYGYSEKAIYYYKIKDVYKNFSKGKENKITLSALPYGNQVLEVKALLPNGKFTETINIKILVDKPFYLKWWFFIVLLLVISSSVYIYIRLRTNKLEKQKEQLSLEVKKRTLKIQKQAEELKALDKTKSRFFANISHELRTPITLIKGPIQSVLNNENLQHKDLELLKKAKNSTNSLLRLVNEILTLTKLEGQKLHLEESTIVLHNFIRQVCGSFQSIAYEKQIKFTVVNKADKELQIQIDKYKVEKVLNNLLSNAFKFTPKKGSVSIYIEDKGEHILIKVSDTGRGIPTKDIPNVFDRYFQSSINNKAEGGLGIGLALSRELVHFLKGKIWVESSTDIATKGTSFFVEFVKVEVLNMLNSQDVITLKENENTPIKNIEPTITETVNKNINPNFKTLLLVEDNKDLREYIKEVLEPFYNVQTAENGHEALIILKQLPYPDLIVSDLMMPVMDGYELLEKVKKNEETSAIPFIVLTARAEQKDKLKALRIGVDDYLLKPFDQDELLVRVDNLILNYQERVSYIQTQQKDEHKKVVKNTIKVKEKDIEWLMFLEENIKNNISNSLFSIDYLAELMQVSRKVIYNKTKTLTGLTPNQYVKAIRLQLAKEILEKGEYKNIKDVALKVGFKKQDYFSSLFKSKFGKLPSEYF